MKFPHSNVALRDMDAFDFGQQDDYTIPATPGASDMDSQSIPATPGASDMDSQSMPATPGPSDMDSHSITRDVLAFSSDEDMQEGGTNKANAHIQAPSSSDDDSQEVPYEYDTTVEQRHEANSGNVQAEDMHAPSSSGEDSEEVPYVRRVTIPGGKASADNNDTSDEELPGFDEEDIQAGSGAFGHSSANVSGFSALNVTDNLSVHGNDESSDDESGRVVRELPDDIRNAHNDDIESDDTDSDLDISDREFPDEEETGNPLFDEYLDSDDFEKPVWVKTRLKSFHVPDFNGPTGLNFPANFDPENASPWQYVRLFVTHEVLQLILNNTNKYATWKQRQKGKTNPFWKKDLTMPELKAFLGISIVMGLNPTPQYSCYWSRSCFMGNEGVKKLMTKNRYEVISQYLHVSDRETEVPRGQDGHDRAAKIRPLMNILGPLFRRMKRPTEHQTIDEAMHKYKGRSALMQYMADKPVKRGLKFFLRNDSESGYLQEFELYLGKEGTRAKSRHGVYFDVVKRLTAKITGRNHRLWMDNLYIGVPILLFLQKNDVYTCGTLRGNRKYIPPQIGSKYAGSGKPRGWSLTFQDKNNPNLTATVWKDTKVVRFLSALSDPKVITTCRRRHGPGYLEVRQPSCAHAYNRFMNGTDQFDQDKGKYPVGRSSKKMWKFLLWFFMSACLVNAWILFKKSTKRNLNKKYGQLQFRLEVVEEMTKDFSSRVQRQVKPNMIARHKNVHMGTKRGRRCKTHKQNFGKNSETTLGCKACGVYLCLLCHTKFHQDY